MSQMNTYDNQNNGCNQHHTHTNTKTHRSRNAEVDV